MTAEAGGWLVLGYGNPGRLDDGLGPAVAARVEALGLPGVRCDANYQLQPEDAALVAEHAVVVFADACTGAGAPYVLRRLLPRPAVRFSTHLMRPEAVVALAERAFGWRGQAYLLGVRGVEFDRYEERLSERARANLDAAVAILARAVRDGDLAAHVTGGPTDDSAAIAHGEESCATAST